MESGEPLIAAGARGCPMNRSARLDHASRVLQQEERTADLRDRYRRCYDKIASDDLIQPLESNKDARNIPLLRFIGDIKGKRVLDIGSAQGLLLNNLRAAQCTVCVDLALTYMRVARANDHHAVVADGEALPFRPDSFDVVICTGVLEHVLDPLPVVHEVKRVLVAGGRFFLLVPWEEPLEKYIALEETYEFTHLRSFDAELIRDLFWQFEIVRQRGVEPKVEKPPHEKLLDCFPSSVTWVLSHLGRIAWRVFDYLEGRLGWRLPRKLTDRYWKWYWDQLAKFPKRDWLWLWFYPPFHMIFEFKLSDKPGQPVRRS
jgi:SAM-dependent methyltransferase